MLVTINAINSRLYKNNSTNYKEKPNLNNIGLHHESSGIFFENNAIQKIEEWEGLNPDTNIAFNEALDTFDEILEYSNESVCNKTCDFLLHEVNKVRDATKLANSIKYKLSKIKKGTSSSIKSLQKKLKAAQLNINNKHTTAIGKIKKESSIYEECYSKLLEKANQTKECDRIIKNYNSISRRFNLDAVIAESVSKYNDIYQATHEICTYIDTYQMPFKNKYNTALETVWYVLNKHYMDCDKSSIIENVTDYFIFFGNLDEYKRSDINDIRAISPIFEQSDFDCINWYLNDEDETEINESHIDPEAYGVDMSSILDQDDLNESAIDKIEDIKRKSPSDKTERNEELQKLINDYKKSCINNKDALTNLSGLKALIDKIVEDMPEQFAFELGNILSIIRVVFILDNFNVPITEINALIEHIITKVIDSALTKKQLVKICRFFEKEISNISIRISDSVDEETKNRLQSYLDQLNNDYNKLKEYTNNILTPDDKYNFYDNQIDPLSKEDIDESEDEWEDHLSDIQDGLTEGARILIISNLIDSIHESFGDSDVTDVISNNIYKLDPEVIDTITDFSCTVPSVIDKESLKENMINYRDSLRNNPTKTMDDYLRIECLNDNINRLAESRTIYNTINDPTGIIAYLMCLDEIAKINSNNEYIIENMSFINTLKLAMNNLKRNAIKLSEKEKAAANTIDSAVNSLTRGMNKNMSAAERERVVRGQFLPCASKCIKIALTAGVGYLIHPAIAVVVALVSFVNIGKNNRRERQLALDEIEVEIKMCERYIRFYEDRNDMKNLRQCEMIYRNLQRQQQRLKYRMSIDFKHADISKLPMAGSN